MVLDTGNPPETDRKASLLKKPQRQIKLELSRKLPPCWVATIVPESATRLLGEEGVNSLTQLCLLCTDLLGTMV